MVPKIALFGAKGNVRIFALFSRFMATFFKKKSNRQRSILPLLIRNYFPI
jgi:hypothetical protein